MAPLYRFLLRGAKDSRPCTVQGIFLLFSEKENQNPSPPSPRPLVSAFILPLIASSA